MLAGRFAPPHIASGWIYDRWPPGVIASFVIAHCVTAGILHFWAGCCGKNVSAVMHTGVCGGAMCGVGSPLELAA